MTLNQVCILLLALALVSGLSRYLLSFLRSDKTRRARLSRVFALSVLQIGSAVLLYCLLFPPTVPVSAGQLTILTANADHAVLKTADRVLALPEAPEQNGVERVPDLATALRRYPGVNHLRILGDGLTARDQDSARNLSLDFTAPDLPRGLVELSLPDKTASGAGWQLQGRVANSGKAKVELLDPGNAVVASMEVDDRGNFRLTDTARAPGLAMYQLRIGDSDKKIIETAKIPLNIVQDPPLKILVLSGGPNPELKYLRRWAVDAGVQLESQITLGPGMQVSSNATAITVDNLRKLDLLILDERAWSAMGRGSKQAVLQELENGLGLLLRITGPLNGTDRNELRALGFTVDETNIVQSIHLKNVGNKLTTLTRRPLRVRSDDAVTLLQDDANNPLALWRAEGRGRIGLFWLTDTYKLALGDNAVIHGQIWRDAVSTTARTRASGNPYLREPYPRVNERVVVCNIAAKAFINEPDAGITYLLHGNEAGNKNCAAYWPRQGGWHSLNSAEQAMPFYVVESDELPGLKANAIHEATSLLASRKSAAAHSGIVAVPGSHWPWFFGWLLVTAALWLLERSRWGAGGSQ